MSRTLSPRTPSPRIAPRAITTITQPMIQRLIPVSADTAVQLPQDLNPGALITTFIIQNYTANPFSVFLVQSAISRPLPSPVAMLEIPPGAAPVFQIPTQTSTDSVLVWDLTGYWLIGDDGFSGLTENVVLAAFPLPT